MNIKEQLKKMDDLSLISIYGAWLNELRDRNIIRTSNVVGELGEYIAIKYYTDVPGLPKLLAAPTGTQNIDAISINGERYSIKATTSKTTGVFYGLNDPEEVTDDKQRFEYVIIVVFNKDFTLRSIYELDWITFITHKRWHKRMRAWNLSINQRLLNDCKIIFSTDSSDLNAIT